MGRILDDQRTDLEPLDANQVALDVTESRMQQEQEQAAPAGVTIPGTFGTRYSGTERITRAQLQPGDLVFYHSPISHVAMYIGNGQVVEAPNSGTNVRVRSAGLTRRGIVGYGRP
jgi:uncharacterized protein YycO